MVATSTVVIIRSKPLRGEKPGNNQQPHLWQGFRLEKTQVGFKGVDKLQALVNTKVDFSVVKKFRFWRVAVTEFVLLQCDPSGTPAVKRIVSF